MFLKLLGLESMPLPISPLSRLIDLAVIQHLRTVSQIPFLIIMTTSPTLIPFGLLCVRALCLFRHDFTRELFGFFFPPLFLSFAFSAFFLLKMALPPQHSQFPLHFLPLLPSLDFLFFTLYFQGRCLT